MAKEAILYRKINKNFVKCLACNHYCCIAKDKTGICGIRFNKNNKLFLLTYGKAVAVNIDPIEKKPLFHFLPNTPVFSFGTIGCNFFCGFCQNWDISQVSKNLNFKNNNFALGAFWGENWPPEKIVKFVSSKKIPSIAYTYNEPAVFFEYAYDTAVLAKEKGIKNIFVSNGYFSKEAFDKIKNYLDAINIDLKSFSDDFYRRICKAKLNPVLDSIKRVYSAGIWLEITTLIIPEENDSPEELKKIANFIASIDKNIPWHISRFFPQYQMTDRIFTPYEKLKEAYQIGKEAGLKYVYIGNLTNEDYESTYCNKCKSLLIRRIGYNIEIEKFNLKKGCCKKCGQLIKGVWK